MNMLLKVVISIACLLLVNIAISVLMFMYDKYSWYLVFLSLSSLYKIILIFVIGSSAMWNFITQKNKKNNGNETNSEMKTVGVLIPCYTEGKEEIMRNINSLKTSIDNCLEKNKNTKFVNVIVVDGISTGTNNIEPTFKIVQNILNVEFKNTSSFMSWKGREINVTYGSSQSQYGDYICICKQENVGKKDSLVLVRELIKNLNNNNSDTILQEYFNNTVKYFGVDKIDYLIGVDADTRVHSDFITESINNIKNDNVLGVSGYAIPDETVTSPLNFWFFYQSFEYHLQQGLTRAGQSIFGKVTCLPGCAQIWKMDDRTLNTPLEKFKEFKDKNSVLQSIRALLGEDRRYTGLVLYENKDCKTKLCENAKAYTSVPTTWSVFLSQRRRWFLSSQVNNIRDTLSSSLPFIVRFIAFSQLWSSAFIFVNIVAIIKFLISLQSPSVLTFIALGFFMFIFFYKCILCFVCAEGQGFQRLNNFLYLLSSALVYSLLAPFINLIIQMWALGTATDYNWGSTQAVRDPSTLV